LSTPKGVRNVLFASFEEIMESCRRRHTSLQAKDLTFEMSTPEGPQRLVPLLSILKSEIRNVLLASLEDIMETWRRRSTF
jgi:hypothetical protein